MPTSTAADRWRDALEARRIPPAILDQAPEPPWGFPVGLFEVRAAKAAGVDDAPTTRRAWAALPEGGRVVDVGCGGGATSLPLATRAGLITGVDQQADMLASFARAVTDAGGRATTVQGTWPEVAGDVAAADVVLCGHVLYNVADLVPFLAALDATATSRVVVEITDRHPLVWMNDLWREFHGGHLPGRPLGRRRRRGDRGGGTGGPPRGPATGPLAAWRVPRPRGRRGVRAPPPVPRPAHATTTSNACSAIACANATADGRRVRPRGRPSSTLWWDVAAPG